MNKNFSISIVALFLIFSFVGSNDVLAYDAAPQISDREIVERLTRLEEGQKSILREMDKRFEALDKRFESIDKRFESIDKRFEEFQNLVIGILASFSAIVAVTIGFAIWDRRTAVKPVEHKMDLITEDLASHRNKLSSLLDALKEKAKTDKDLAAVLRSFSIL